MVPLLEFKLVFQRRRRYRLDGGRQGADGVLDLPQEALLAGCERFDAGIELSAGSERQTGGALLLGLGELAVHVLELVQVLLERLRGLLSRFASPAWPDACPERSDEPHDEQDAHEWILTWAPSRIKKCQTLFPLCEVSDTSLVWYS